MYVRGSLSTIDRSTYVLGKYVRACISRSSNKYVDVPYVYA